MRGSTEFRSFVNIDGVWFLLKSLFYVYAFVWVIVIVGCRYSTVVNIVKAPRFKLLLNWVILFLREFPIGTIFFGAWRPSSRASDPRRASYPWRTYGHGCHWAICCINLLWFLAHFSILCIFSVFMNGTCASFWRINTLLTWWWLTNYMHFWSYMWRYYLFYFCWKLYRLNLISLRWMRHVLIAVTASEGVLDSRPLRFQPLPLWLWFVRNRCICCDFYNRIINIFIGRSQRCLDFGYRLVFHFIIFIVIDIVY